MCIYGCVKTPPRLAEIILWRAGECHRPPGECRASAGAMARAHLPRVVKYCKNADILRVAFVPLRQNTCF